MTRQSGRGGRGGDRVRTWLDIRPPSGALVDEALDREAERDLFERAKPGAFVYALVWAVVTPWSGMWSGYPLVAAANMTFLVGLSTLRVVNIRHARSDPSVQIEAFRWLTLLILTGALHWGVMSAWIIFSGNFESLRYPFLIMLPAFGMGGTAVLGISNNIRILYPGLILFPSMITGTVIGGQENWTLVVLATCAMAYVMIASRTSSADYWKAISNAKVAAERAEQLEEQSLTDPLTGIHNRLFFNTYLREQWTSCARQHTPLGLALIDLDHFKDVNDRYGHLAGDECLRLTAALLKQNLRNADHVVTRYGGEEFVAILPGVDLDEALNISRRLVDRIAGTPFEYDGHRIELTCSIGVSSIVPDLSAGTIEHLVAHADEALYDAKAKGRNRARSTADLRS